MSNWQENFSERLRQVRLEKSLTMPELAEKISKTKQAIDLFEKAKAKPSFDIFCDLAEILDVSLDYIAGRSDDPKIHKLRKKP